MDVEQERLWKGSIAITLRRKPFAILRYLAQRPKQLVTHEELLAQVWRGQVVSDSAMRSHLHELRQQLGDGVIETVVGRGYRFVAELGADGLAPDAPAVDPLVVGRESELQSLRDLLSRAHGGNRQVCFMTGEPGMGKSTLVRTFLAELDPHAVFVARGVCFEQHGTPEPYLALIDALSGLARTAHGAPVLTGLVRHAPSFVLQVPNLVNDAQLEEVKRRAVGGNESRQLRELCDALEAMASLRPLVLVLEDLQWSDIATIDLLSLLAQRQGRARLLVIATSRHADVQASEHPLNRVMRSLVARSHAVAMHVQHIAPDAVQHFIDRRFAGHAFPLGLTALVATITGGTPLFMVSFLDELVGRGMLAERDGRWTMTIPLEQAQAHRPASVKQLIDMQLDRLSLAEQRVLEAASVVGSEFSTHLVAAALQLPVEQVDDVCDALQRRSAFVRAEPDDRYAVTHALVQEVCCERSSPARRQRWHLLVAEAIEREARGGDVSHLLAKHYDAAGDALRATRAYLSAARQAAERYYASSDAVALCARALDLVARLAPSRERDALELEVLTLLCQQVNSNSFSAVFSGREPRALHARAIEIARASADPQLVYSAITQLCKFNMIVAQYDLSAELASELERIEATHELDPALVHTGIFARAYIAYFSADLGTALRLLERLVSSEEAGAAFRGNLAGRALALGHLACLRWVIGEPEQALREASETIDVAAAVGSPILSALGHTVRARLRFFRRDPATVIEGELPAALQATAIDQGLSLEVKAFGLWLEASRGALEMRVIEPLLGELQRRLTEVATCSTLIGLTLIEVLRTSGHAAPARALTEEMIGFARSHNEIVYLPELLRVRGEQRESTDVAAALQDYRDAVALARASGARSLELRAARDVERLSIGRA